MPGQVPEDVKTARLHRLQALIMEQQTACNAACVGRTMSVLVEKPGRHPGQVVGKSPYLQPVHFNGPETLMGQIVTVEITGRGSNSLAGQIVQPTGQADAA